MREMKDSGVAWIGEIPTSWDTKAIRNLLIERNEKNRELSVKTILSLSAKSGVTLYSSENHSGNKPREDLSDYKIVRENDIVVNSMNILSGSVGLSKYTGVVSPVYYIYYPREKNNVQYLYFIFQCFEFQRSLRGLGNGILIKETESGSLNTIRMRIPSKKLSLQELPSPPIDEQEKIAAHLDRKCTQIDALISNAQQQIEKLKAYKQSVITETVTKGLDPDVQMKDSGVEWIGEIPEHWSVSKVGYFYDITLGKMLQPNSKENDTLEQYLCAMNVGGNTLSMNIVKEMWFSEKEKEYYALHKGDLLVVEGGDIASSAILNFEPTNLYFQNALHRVKAKKGTNEFLRYWLMFAKSRGFFDMICNRATIAHFTKDKFINLPFVMVTIQEQQQIIKYLDRKCSQIDKLIALKQQKIEKLQQYKKSLIYEYVTGKKEA